VILLFVSFLGSVFTKAKKKVKTEKSSGGGSGLEALAKKAEQSKADLEAKKEEEI
jgi:hypothetical protein